LFCVALLIVGLAQPDPPSSEEEIPEEMVEFLLMMDLVERYGEVLDVELELQEDDTKTEPLEE